MSTASVRNPLISTLAAAFPQVSQNRHVRQKRISITTKQVLKNLISTHRHRAYVEPMFGYIL